MNPTAPSKGNKLIKKRTLAVPRTEETTDIWLTPKPIIDALGPFDLDPCHLENRPFETAANYFTITNDGLQHPWAGKVFCNPPYGAQTGAWLAKMAQHANGFALVFAKTETDAMAIAWAQSSGLLFLRRRIQFLLPDGTLPPLKINKEGKKSRPGPGCGSVIIAFGQENARHLQRCGLEGWFVEGARFVGGNRLFEDL